MDTKPCCIVFALILVFALEGIFPHMWERLARAFCIWPDTHAIVFGLPAFREERFQRLLGFLITPFL